MADPNHNARGAIRGNKDRQQATNSSDWCSPVPFVFIITERESDRCSTVEWQLGHKSSIPVTGVPIREWVRLKKCIPIRQPSTHGKIQQESLACKHLLLFWKIKHKVLCFHFMPAQFCTIMHTQANQELTQGEDKRRPTEEEKNKTVYAIRTQCKSQNCGISYITLYVHHVTRKKKYIVDQFGVHLSVPVSSHCSPESVAGGPCLLRPRAPSAWQCRRRRTVCCNQKCSFDEDQCVIR